MTYLMLAKTIWIVIAIPVFLAVFSHLLGKKPKGFHTLDIIALAFVVGIAWPAVTWLLYSNPGGWLTRGSGNDV